jgi:hypothetical protein
MRLCAERGAAAVNAARAELGPRRFQRELVNDRLMLVDGAVDAVELLGREHVDRQAFLDLGDALLVLGFERFEGALKSSKALATSSPAAPALVITGLSPLVSIISVWSSSLISFLFSGAVIAPLCWPSWSGLPAICVLIGASLKTRNARGAPRV